MTSPVYITDPPWSCKGDLSADCSAAFAACLIAAGGRPVHAPVGRYLINSPAQYSGIVNLIGDGNGCGPGPAAISPYNCTQFVAPNGLVYATTNYPCTFRYFQTQGVVNNTAILVQGPSGSSNANSQFEGLGFSNCRVPLQLVRPIVPRITGCYFDTWGIAAVHMTTTPGVEGNGGNISENFFFGPAGNAAQGPAIYTEVGYFSIHHNTSTGGQGFLDAVACNGPCGSLVTHDNSIEDYGLYGVRIGSRDGSAVSMVRMHDDEFCNVAYGAAAIAAILIDGAGVVGDVIIHDETVRAVAGPNSSFMNITSGPGLSVHHNNLDNLGAKIAVGIAVNAPEGAVLDNRLRGTYGAKYGLSPGVTLREI